jgi:hypothetical protein
VKAALARCLHSGDHKAMLGGLGLADFPEGEASAWQKLNDALDAYGVDLSANSLRSLPAKISSLLANASGLNLARNQLAKLVPTFSLLRNLRVLDLSHNRFTDIPTELYKLKQLEELHMAHNFLIYIPNVFFDEMAGLRALDFTGNKIVELPSTVSRCAHTIPPSLFFPSLRRFGALSLSREKSDSLQSDGVCCSPLGLGWAGPG